MKHIEADMPVIYDTKYGNALKFQPSARLKKNSGTLNASWSVNAYLIANSDHHKYALLPYPVLTVFFPCKRGLITTFLKNLRLSYQFLLGSLFYDWRWKTATSGVLFSVNHLSIPLKDDNQDFPTGKTLPIGSIIDLVMPFLETEWVRSQFSYSPWPPCNIKSERMLCFFS